MSIVSLQNPRSFKKSSIGFEKLSDTILDVRKYRGDSLISFEEMKEDFSNFFFDYTRNDAPFDGVGRCLEKICSLRTNEADERCDCFSFDRQLPRLDVFTAGMYVHYTFDLLKVLGAVSFTHASSEKGRLMLIEEASLFAQKALAVREKANRKVRILVSSPEPVRFNRPDFLGFDGRFN